TVHALPHLVEHKGVRFGVGMSDIALLMVTSLCLVVSARPGDDSFIAKAADWARDNHLGGLVNWVEEKYYTWTAPPKGGSPHRVIEIEPVSTTAEPMTFVTAAVRAHSKPPANVTPFASPPVDNEGVWYPIGPTVDGFPTALAAQLRPDAEHTSV